MRNFAIISLGEIMNYLISSESYHLLNDEIKKIFKDENYVVFNLNKNSLNDCLVESSYYGLGEDHKYILASNASFFGSGKITEEETNSLLNYLERPNPKTTIIFTCLEKVDARKKIVKFFKNQNTYIDKSLKDKRSINTYLKDYLQKYDYTADYETINYIMNNSYDNLDIMINDLEKIMLYYCFPGKIKKSDVVKIIGKQIESNNFHFINSVIDKNLKESFIILKDLRKRKVEPSSLIVLLAREYRLMYYAKKMNSKYSFSEILKKLNLQEWQLNKLYTNASKYTLGELKDLLRYLSVMDVQIKKGLCDKDIAFYAFLLEAAS